jgi:hypothetical protein
MDYAEDQPPQNNYQHRMGRYVNGRLASVLDCELGHHSGAPHGHFAVITFGEPDGTLDVVCVSPTDGARLCKLLQTFEAVKQAVAPTPSNSVQPRLKSLAQIQADLQRKGIQPYLRHLNTDLPPLAIYLQKQLMSLTRSIRRHCSSPSAARSMERRLSTTVMVIVDFLRPPANG